MSPAYKPLDNLTRATLASLKPSRKVFLSPENVRVIAYSADVYGDARFIRACYAHLGYWRTETK